MYVKAILETGSGRKLSHNGCTADNFDLPNHGFFTSNLLHRVLWNDLRGIVIKQRH